MLGHVARVVAERLRSLARFPSADTILERLRQVPVVERGEGFDAVGEQLVDEAIVEVEPFGIGRAAALRKDARPGDGKSVCLDAEGFHQLDVALVAVVVIVGDVTVRVVGDLAGRVGERVPNGRHASVFGDGALDLIGRGCGAPEEAGRERARSRSLERRCLALGRLRGEGNGRRAECGGAGELGERAAGELVGH